MDVLDLFSGIGAFSIAAESTGMNIIAHSEIDKNCQKLLKQKYPNVPQLGDICHVKKENIPQTVTLIAGGSPCQNLSIAGRGEGLVGKESQLWFEYLRLVKEFSPEWLVWENVPNALSSNGGLDFLTILRGLDECGYHVAWRVLDAQYFGVPQRRRRIFIVGNLRDGCAAKALFEPEIMPGNASTRPSNWEAARASSAITGSADRTHHRGNTEILSFSPATYKRDFDKKPLRAIRAASTLMAPTHGWNDTTECIIINGVIRRFTPLECERLMGFPDGWTNGFSDSARYSMLGNSIAVPVAKWIFERIAGMNNETD